MTIKVNGLGNREFTFIKGFHVSKFAGGRKPRKINPGGVVAMLVIVPFFFDFTE